MDSKRFHNIDSPLGTSIRPSGSASSSGFVQLEETDGGSDNVQDTRCCYSDDQSFEPASPKSPSHDSSFPNPNSEQEQRRDQCSTYNRTVPCCKKNERGEGYQRSSKIG